MISMEPEPTSPRSLHEEGEGGQTGEAEKDGEGDGRGDGDDVGVGGAAEEEEGGRDGQVQVAHKGCTRLWAQQPAAARVPSKRRAYQRARGPRRRSSYDGWSGLKGEEGGLASELTASSQAPKSGRRVTGTTAFRPADIASCNDVSQL